MKESEIIKLIESSKYSDIFKKYRKAKHVKVSENQPNGVYFVHHGAKIRYIDPLCGSIRILEICKDADESIKRNFPCDMGNYVYLDFDF